MRILKKYSAIRNLGRLTDENSRLFRFEETDEAVAYISAICETGFLDTQSKYAVAEMTAGVFGVLNTGNDSDNPYASADYEKEIRVACVNYRYYSVLAFEFPRFSIPLKTLNRGASLLSAGKRGEVSGFMGVTGKANRVNFKVNSIDDQIRLVLVKEKKYPKPKPRELAQLGKAAEFTVIEDGKLSTACGVCGASDFTAEAVCDCNLSADLGGDTSEFPENICRLISSFSARVFAKFGKDADAFITREALFYDNLICGEVSAILLRDENGECAGGAVWQKSNGVIVIMMCCVFDDDKANITSLLNLARTRMSGTDATFAISKKIHCEQVASEFRFSDKIYRYEPLHVTDELVSYVSSDLLNFVKKRYAEFGVRREIREITYEHRFYEPYSVLSSKIDADDSEAVLSPMFAGDDLKSNIIRHVNVLKRIGIEKIYFQLDLGDPEEAIMSGLVKSCGFEPTYLWPSSDENGDAVVFVHVGNGLEVRPCTIVPVTKDNIGLVPDLVRRVYGDEYSSPYLYDPAEFYRRIRARFVRPYVAVDDDGNVLGMIAFLMESTNPYLLELGQLMVDPKYRGTSVATQLSEYCRVEAAKLLAFDAVVSECVTNHRFSQRGCAAAGFVDVALKLNLVGGETYKLESEARQVERMTCTICCTERANETFDVYLPAVYTEQIKFCFEGLAPRTYKEADTDLPRVLTEYKIDEHYIDPDEIIIFTIFTIGEDVDEVMARVESRCAELNVKCLLANVPLGDPHNAAVVDVLRRRRFFFGGVMPYWTPVSDALLMQKLYDNAPDWSVIKLFGKKIKRIAQLIREDIEAVAGLG